MSEKPKRSTLPPPPRTFAGRCWEQLRLGWLLFQDNRVPLRVKLVPVIGLAYLLSPFGFIPALIPIIGQIDALAVILFTVAIFNSLAPKEIVAETLARLRTGAKPSWQVSREEGGTVIDNQIRYADEMPDEAQSQDTPQKHSRETEA